MFRVARRKRARTNLRPCRLRTADREAASAAFFQNGLFVAVECNPQRRVGANSQDLALPRIVATQLPDDAPLAVHKFALLNVAEPDNLRPGRVGGKSNSDSAAHGPEVKFLGPGCDQDRSGLRRLRVASRGRG